MESPYRKQLRRLMGQEVTIHRAGAENLKGTVKSTPPDGCIIDQLIDTADSVTRVFVAYSDIRGVAGLQWNLENL